MNTVIVANVLRFFGLVLVQGLVFQNIAIGWEEFPYLQIIVFPLFILLLPLRTPRALVVFLGFLAGIFVDVLYNTPGVHASAAVFLGFVRPVVLGFMEPRSGFNVTYSPTAARFGMGWFFWYSAISMLVYLLFYFSVEAFTFVYIVDILLKTVVSFVVSMIFIVIYQLLFNPVD